MACIYATAAPAIVAKRRIHLLHRVQWAQTSLRRLMSQAGDISENRPVTGCRCCQRSAVMDEAAMIIRLTGGGLAEICSEAKAGLKAKHHSGRQPKLDVLYSPTLLTGTPSGYITVRCQRCLYVTTRLSKHLPPPQDTTAPYNGEILLPGLSDLTLVEGFNVISAFVCCKVTVRISLVFPERTLLKKALWLMLSTLSCHLKGRYLL